LYNQVRLVVYTGALVVSGGVTAGDSNGNLVLNSGTLTRFHTKPLNMGTRTFYSDSGGLVILDVAGNTWAHTMIASGTLRCDVPNALPATSSLRLGIGYGPNGTVNLNGNNQTVSKLYLDITNSGLRVITSPTPALLSVNQTENTFCDVQFAGAVSLLKTGTGSLSLTNATTSTTGSFIVSNGTLVVSSTGTLGVNSTNIVVGGTGTLLLSNSVAIANSAAVRMPAVGTTTAKINLATSVNETVGWLYFGDKLQRAGTYGSTGSIAALKDNEHFAGTGMITVLHDKSGSLLRVQ
jgi:autotransporter-associated beta strand protein